MGVSSCPLRVNGSRSATTEASFPACTGLSSQRLIPMRRNACSSPGSSVAVSTRIRGLRRDAEFPGTDLPRDVEPGHVREAHVQQYGVGLQFADEVQGVLSAARHVRGISGLRQRFAEEQGRNRRIFSDHQPSARPRFCGAVRLGEGGGRSGARGGGRFRQAVRVGRQTEQGCEGEHAAHAGRAGERQVAAEAPRDVAGDGKPEAHAGFVLIARIPDAGALFEALEDAFLFVRGDAPAGVDDLEGQARARPSGACDSARVTRRVTEPFSVNFTALPSRLPSA